MPETGATTRRAAQLPRPTRSAALLLVFAVILELLGRLINSPGVNVAAAAALGAVLGDAVLTPRLDALTVTRDAAARLTVGLPALVRLSFQAPAGRFGARRSVALLDEHPALPAGRAVTPRLRGGQLAVADLRLVPPKRGYWNADARITVEGFSPLGGFVRRQTVTLAWECWVHPAASAPLRSPASPPGTGFGPAASTRSGSGMEFFGTREWRSGDPSAAIHWRSSARRAQLVVIERERPAYSALIVIAAPVADRPAGEATVARVAATCLAALRSGQELALVTDSTVTFARSPGEVLDWFAALDPTSTPDPSVVATALREAGPGATVLWLADGPPLAAVTVALRSGSAGAVVMPKVT